MLAKLTPRARHVTILLALVVIAAVCYAVGYRKGSLLAIVLGVIVEIAFWVNLTRGAGKDQGPRD